MDFNDKDSNNNDTWEWGDVYSRQRDSVNDYSQCLWDNVNVNEDSFMYILDDQTPIKDCREFGYQACNVVDSANKGIEECVEISQMKHRRMLQFTSDANEIGIGNEEFASVCLKSKIREDSMMEDGMSENSDWNSRWNIESHDDRCDFNFEGWNQESEEWLVNCLDETEIRCSLNQMDGSMVSDDQVYASDFHNISHKMGTDALRETLNPSPIKIIKGRNSFLKTPKKLVTPIVYPFALIKPCGVQGDVTLKDINQRIHAPPPSRSKNKLDEDPSSSTSAYSGKPVVLKTKIRTEGGKGSITIMRTKG